MKSTMNTRELQLFLQLSEMLHFGRASEACHVSPSALSRTIKQLENDLGTTLFERDNRTVSLTREGRLLQEYARESLNLWDSFKHSLMEETRELQGEISIYCSVTASYSFLYDILSKFRLNYPKIEIKLHTGDPTPAVSRVLAGQEDITIAARPDKLPAGIAFQRITMSPLVFICPKEQTFDLPVNPDMNVQDWTQLPMILSEEGLARKRLNRWFQMKKISPRIYAQVAGHEAIVSMVSLGFGIGLVPRIVLDNSPLSNRVEILKNQPDLKPYDVGICVLEKRLKNPLINAFWSQIKQ